MTSNIVSRLYFKITNPNEKHHGFQYYDGLNELLEKFNDDPKASCVAGVVFILPMQNIF